MKDNCIACEILNGTRSLPGGIIKKTDYWSIEPCIGPFPVGTLILKPIRHVLNFSELNSSETEEFGQLLKLTTKTIKDITGCDQTYICQWSHAGWEPVHIHFVIQPVWNNQKADFERPGPYMQYQLFENQDYPENDEIAAFADKAREMIL